MKKTQLKQLIKPLVKECIHEVLLEEGLLTEVVSQVAAGMPRQQLVESTPAPRQTEDAFAKQRAQKATQAKAKLQEHRKKMMDAIGNDAFNGVDLFEGTEPLRESGTPGQAHRPNVLGDDPNDSGVDISSILGGSSQIWKAMNK
jgi:hypothetical protein